MQLHQLDKRIRKMLEYLKQMTMIQSIPVENIQISHRNLQDWTDFKNGECWGNEQEEWFDFRFSITIPSDFIGQPILHVLTGREGEWEALNPQIVVWVNGAIAQAFDTRHHSLILSDKPESGRTYDIYLQAYVPKLEPMQNPARLLIELRDINTEVLGLLYDIKVPWEAACLTPEGNRDRECTLEILSEALNRLDLRIPQSEAFQQSILDARAFLHSEYYEKREKMDVTAVANCIGHTHIDCAWLWDLDQTRHKAVRSFSTMLRLMDEYPEFKFMSSQPLLYQMVKGDQPELFERIVKAVKRGQWQPEGGMWVEADCNLPSGESLVRQFLHGQEFFEREFGERCRILWLPDVFGYSAAMPQIMKKSGIDYFYTSKLSWSEFNLYPYDTFLWKGIDSSEVLTHFTPARDVNEGEPDLDHFTTYNAMLNPTQMQGGWNRFQQKALDNHFLVSYGYGDGGGGTTSWMIENARRMSVPLPGTPVVKHTFPRTFFEELEARVTDHPRLPKWSGELYLEYHRGTYTAMARNKRFNRKMELALRDAEFLCTYAGSLCGFPYPSNELHDLWETVLTLQFHDILPGSSIKKVYDDALEMYTDVETKVNAIRSKAMASIAATLNGDLLAFNTLSSARNDILYFDAPEQVSALKDMNGNTYPVQHDHGIACAYVSCLPPLSVTPLFFSTKPVAQTSMEITYKTFETPFFKGTFDESMRITSLIDKANGRELCKKGEALNCIVCYENRPHNFDAWDINIYYDQKYWEITDVTKTELISKGPVMTKVRVHYAFNRSTIVQDIIFYRDIDRIDFETTVDWKEVHYMLKAHFPADIYYNEATFDIQYGNLKRPTHKNTSWDTARFEVCAHKWADVSEPGYGLSLLNDCKYGYSADENSIALTLLKSSDYPNPEADQEVHHFTYSIYPHSGDWRSANTPDMAYRLNIPVLTATGTGTAASCTNFAELNRNNVILETVKQALDGSGTILRLYECFGMRTDVDLKLHVAAKHAVFTNMLKDTIETADFDNDTIHLKLKPYEIVTLKVW
ncbi:MAG: glycoside hydrolase family 38 C-terminal domain-containing protein [Lachnospiraceae bacterium]|nr:glycoside hydrolase family 38 C-terminal domain-containing protein [Lachnospiraceae bacterium]